jgi:hypothetical protein
MIPDLLELLEQGNYVRRAMRVNKEDVVSGARIIKLTIDTHPPQAVICRVQRYQSNKQSLVLPSVSSKTAPTEATKIAPSRLSGVHLLAFKSSMENDLS